MSYLYPRQKINGIWLVYAGTAMFLLLIQYHGIPNIWPFIIAYIVGMIWQLSPKTRAKLSVGEGTDKQKKYANISIFILAILVITIVNVFGYDYHVSWLLILLAVGFHFLIFVPVHGKLMIFLSIFLTINALVGLFNITISLDIFFIMDGIIKIIFGLIFIKLSPINF